MSDPFIKNENSVLPILIEKNSEKNLLFSLENEIYFFKQGKSIFFIKLGQRLPKSFSQLHEKTQDFSTHTF